MNRCSGGLPPTRDPLSWPILGLRDGHSEGACQSIDCKAHKAARFHNIASSAHAQKAATARGARQKGLPPASLLPSERPPTHQRAKLRQDMQGSPTGPTRITCIMQKNVITPISRGARILMQQIMLRFLAIPTPSTDHLSVSPLACARGAQTSHRVSARAASRRMGTHGVVARARPSGQALARSPAALPHPAPGPGALHHDLTIEHWLAVGYSRIET